MRVLITGIGGFIGSSLADRLVAEGHEVFGVDNLETGRAENFPELVEFGIADRHMLYDYANGVGPELVIHCAASYKDPDAWHRDTSTNIAGTINVINVARYHDAKLVYFQTALPPVSSYANSKIAAEHYIRISGIGSLIFRLSNIYGPRNLSGPIPNFYKRLSANERCTVVPTVRDMVYIDDLVECVMLALKRDRLGRFDICSGEALPILALYRAVAAFFPDAPEPNLSAIARDDVMPATSVHAWLNNWQPIMPLVEGIAETVAWYGEHGIEETFTHLKLEEETDANGEAAA